MSQTLNQKDPLEILDQFLTLHYHEEPDDTKALLAVMDTTELEGIGGNPNYRWDLSVAFQKVLAASYPAGTLTHLVREAANRHALDDDQAHRFLENIYDTLGLDVALDYNDLDEDDSEDTK